MMNTYMNKMISVGLAMIVILLSFSTCKRPNNPKPPDSTVKKYSNPVFEPVFADPTILNNRKVDGYFYAYGTEDNWGTTAEDEHMIPIIRSKDLVHWEYLGNAFDSLPAWNVGKNFFWAPDIQYRNGKYYLYYAISSWGASNPAIGVAVSDTPDGKFKDLGKILDSNSTGVPNAIDPCFFTDTDGKSYLFFGSFGGIYGVPMKDDGITAKINEKFQIAGTVFEGTYIFKRNGYYYFFGSSGSCCNGANSTYHVTVARSKNLRGPYFNINGNNILYISDPNYGIYDKSVDILFAGRKMIAPGHDSEIVEDDNGQDWILYHAIEKPNYTLPNGAAKRPLMLDKVTWDNNGWPKIGLNGYPTEYSTEAPIFK